MPYYKQYGNQIIQTTYTQKL